MKIKKINAGFKLLILLLLLAIGIILSIGFGTREINVINIIISKGNSISPFEKAVLLQRVPRTIFGILIGLSLGISGALMQGVTRNPLADPSILGINSGAALSVVIGLSFFNISNNSSNIWLALIGASLTALIVYFLGSMGKGGQTPIKLALAGVSVSSVFVSITQAILIPRAYVLDKYRFWLIGSIGSGNWDTVRILIPFFVVGILISLMVYGNLDSMQLGDEMATSLGVNVKRTRFLAFLSGVILAGASTALAGPIAFVGLVAPHIIRLVFGPSMKILLPLSGIFGAVILVYSDVIGRIIAPPGEIEVGIITAFVGGPILIYFARNMKGRTL